MSVDGSVLSDYFLDSNALPEMRLSSRCQIEQSKDEWEEEYSKRKAQFLENTKHILKKMPALANQSENDNSKISRTLSESPTDTLNILENTLKQLYEQKKCNMEKELIKKDEPIQIVDSLNNLGVENNTNKNSNGKSLLKQKSPDAQSQYKQTNNYTNSITYAIKESGDYQKRRERSKSDIKSCTIAHNDDQQSTHSKNFGKVQLCGSQSCYSSDLSSIVAKKLEFDNHYRKHPEQYIQSTIKTTHDEMNTVPFMNEYRISLEEKSLNIKNSQSSSLHLKQAANTCGLKDSIEFEDISIFMSIDGSIIDELEAENCDNDCDGNNNEKESVDRLSLHTFNGFEVDDDNLSMETEHTVNSNFSMRNIVNRYNLKGVIKSEPDIMKYGECNNSEKENEKEQKNENATKTSKPKKFNFTEGLKIDELETEIGKLRKEVENKTTTITDLRKQLTKASEVTAEASVSGSTAFNALYYNKYATINKNESNCNRKSSLDNFEIQNQKVDKGENAKAANVNASPIIPTYDPNSTTVLRNKIKDLESQVQDLQEANEEANKFISMYRHKMDTELDTDSNKIFTELINTNKELRLELEHFRNLNLEGNTSDIPSSVFLRKELENLKSDLKNLKQQNNFVLLENIKLKQLLKSRDDGMRYPDECFNNDFSATGGRTLKGAPVNKVPVALRMNNGNCYQSISDCMDLSKTGVQSVPVTSTALLITPNTMMDEENSQLQAPNQMPSLSFEGENGTSGVRNNNVLNSMSSDNLTDDILDGMEFDNDRKVIEVIDPINRQQNDYHNQQQQKQQPHYVIKHHPVSAQVDYHPKGDITENNDDASCLITSAVSPLIQGVFVPPVPYNDTVNEGNENSFISSFQHIPYAVKKSKSIKVGHSSHDVTNLQGQPNVENSVNVIKNELNMFSTLHRMAFAPKNGSEINKGDVVKFIRQGGRISKGLVHYVGHLPRRNDMYVGVELELEDGKHDGIYEGMRYFKCKENKGVFVAFNKIIMVYSKQMSNNSSPIGRI